jgi:hypothetical protein
MFDISCSVDPQVRITLGEYVLKSDVEPLPGRTYGATEIKVHPHFKFTPQADRYDVAVVRLNRPVDFAPHISPICLPPKDMEMHGMHGWATGWGALKPGSSLRPKTLQVSVRCYVGRFQRRNSSYRENCCRHNIWWTDKLSTQHLLKGIRCSPV